MTEVETSTLICAFLPVLLPQSLQSLSVICRACIKTLCVPLANDIKVAQLIGYYNNTLSDAWLNLCGGDAD